MKAEWLNGPAFVTWLEKRGIRACDVERSSRTVSRWRNGGRVSLATADRILSDHDYHLTQLPDSFWTEGSPRNAYPAELREKTIREYAAGAQAAALQRVYGPSEDTIRRWAGSAGVPAKWAPHPDDLRKAAITAYAESEESVVSIAERFGVSEGSVRRWGRAAGVPARR